MKKVHEREIHFQSKLELSHLFDRTKKKILENEFNMLPKLIVVIVLLIDYNAHEHLEHGDVRVVKRDGIREPFSRDKLLNGFVKACEKRPVSIEILERAVDSIISELESEGCREVLTQVLGAKVMTKLERIDPVAYVRYASVYRQFQDVGEFIDEIESLGRRP